VLASIFSATGRGDRTGHVCFMVYLCREAAEFCVRHDYRSTKCSMCCVGTNDIHVPVSQLTGRAYTDHIHLLLSCKLNFDDLIRNSVLAGRRNPGDVAPRARRHHDLVVHQCILGHSGIYVSGCHAVAHLCVGIAAALGADALSGLVRHGAAVLLTL
jgi:hypothetical protein